MKSLFCFLAWLFALGLIIILILRFWTGDTLMPGRLVSYFMPWILFLLFPIMVAAGITQRTALLGALAASFLFIGLSYAPLFLPSVKNVCAASGSLSLKVVSYNIWSRNPDISGISRIIQKMRPDILLLQEVEGDDFIHLTEHLQDLYPDDRPYFSYAPSMLQAVVSRYPLTPIENATAKGQAQKVRVITPAGVVTVFNVHPLRKGSWQRRHRQISALLQEDILPCPGPVILGGDFNTTDQTQTYRMLSQHLKNAHWESGWGFGFSFPSLTWRPAGIPLPPLIRIDHIFYNNHFTSRTAGTLKLSGGSDHYPVHAELLLEEVVSRR